jgi:hypothetical protein
MDKKNLASLVEPLDKQLADMLQADQSTLAVVPTPFFRNGAIYKVMHKLPTRPVVFTVGQSGESAWLLASNPPAFFELARKAGVILDTDELRIAYVTTFLETTRSFAHRFDILHDVAQLKPRPNLSGDQLQRFQKIVAQYGPVLRQLILSGDGPWTLVVYAVRRQSLVRLDTTLRKDGAIDVREAVLEEYLPIPYAH